ncbi:MAG TPA: ATP-binding protein [Thiobacillaceae bacterium]|nr:ATP-binding protein [Thiobacillaceae bacterium]
MHPLLERQLRDHLNPDMIGQALPETFLAAVDRAYQQADAMIKLKEQSLDVMTRELTERNTALQDQLVELQRAETQLEHLLMLLGTTLESTVDGILVLDREARSVRFNRSFSELWRVPDDILAFWSHEDLMRHVLDQVQDPQAFSDMLEHLCRHPELEGHDTVTCIDGRIMERHSLPHFQGIDNIGRVVSFQDITQRRLAEAALLREKEEQKKLIAKLQEAHDQLLQSEKMASIGQLAAGVAHEINNPIGYISSNLGTLRNYVEGLLHVVAAYEAAEADLPPVSSWLAEIAEVKRRVDLDYLKEDVLALLTESDEGTERVRRIVQDLKDFAHADQGEWVWADLHKGLDTTLNVVHNEIKYKAEVVKEYGQMPSVKCLPYQLNQLFMNLLVNAAHAIEEKGTIRVRTGSGDDGTVWVEIADTGKGIPAEIRNKIFDPFFTTKPVGKGTGLGLSISYGIVNKHGGRIEVDSEVGKGTTFRVILAVQPPEQGADHG